jgi:hypothetical protein
MNVWQVPVSGLALSILIMLPAGQALATTITGRASTVVEWFDDLNEETIVPAFQYLQLNALDIGNKGYDFRFYGRGGTDLADERSSYAESRLYFAYLEKRGFLHDGLDFRLGRQFISTTAGASLMDGLRLDHDFLDNYRLTLFGGGDVTYHEGYSLKDVILGGELAGGFMNDDLNLGLSYVAKLDEGLLAQELLGLEAAIDLFDALYLYNETQYDWLSDRLSYLLVGGKYHQFADWTARIEYLYSLPVFSSTSIFSVFAVDEYEEVLAELTYNLPRNWRAFGRYSREIYQDFEDADVFEAGIEKLRTRQFGGYLSGVYRDGGQDLKGFKARVSYLLRNMLLLGAGTEIDVLDRQVKVSDADPATDLDPPTEDTTSRRYWIDMTYFLSNQLNVQAKVERVESDFWDYYHRGRVRLNLFF